MTRRGNWRRVVALVLAVAVVGVAGFWAGRVTLADPADDNEAAALDTTVAVREISVGRTLTFSVTVTQPFVPVAVNSLDGIVTWVRPDGPVESGDILFAVAGQPVIAVQGEVPFYRDLIPGSIGEDVAQLQRALTAWGHPVPDEGRFGPATGAAVRAWQAASGQATTGVVHLGTLLALPELPTAIHLADALVRGSQVAGGEKAVLARTGEPHFALVLGSDQAALVPTGAAVEVQADNDVTWQAVAGPAAVDEFGMVVIALTAPDGSLVCGDACHLLDGSERSTLLSTVHVVPTASGPGVPVAAIHSAADGRTYVVLADGSRREVTVVASGDGLAVIDGVAPGTQLQLGGRPVQAEAETAGEPDGEYG